MERWETDSGEDSKYFGTSNEALVERVKVHAKANNLPVERVSAVFDSVSGPGGPFEITEGYLRTDSGSTAAPHLQGPKGNGQRYRYFKNGPHLLGDWYTTFCTRNDMQDFIVYQESCTDVS